MKIIEIIVDTAYEAITSEVAEKYGAVVLWQGSQQEGERHLLRLLVEDEQRQGLLDELQTHLGTSPSARILVMPVEAALPRPPVQEESGDKESGATREELYNEIEKNARLTGPFLILVFLSTIVAAIGLIEDNVAVVIGAMVIAPLLGPNIALALGAALGDKTLILKSLRTGGAGLGLALAVSILIGMLWPTLPLDAQELMARTDVGLDSVALALASGGAAVLSMTTGLPSVLVGVMVAVALLPPTATMGLMLGHGDWDLALGAGLLLAVNIVCVNLAAKIAFLARGITPRTLWEKQEARRSVVLYIVIWILSLAVLVAAILIKHS